MSKSKPPPGRDPRAAATCWLKTAPRTSSPPVAAPQALRHDARFRHLVRRLHELSPRALGELLLELGRVHSIEADVTWRLERIAALDPATVVRLGGCGWPRMPLAAVR